MNKAVFVGCNALGDTVCTTPALRAFRRANPDTFVVYVVHNAAYCRVLDANPDVDLVIYNEHMWLHGWTGVTESWLQSLPLDLDAPADVRHFNMDLVCSRAESFEEHIATGFSKLLGIPIESVRPTIAVTEGERRAAHAFVRRPYVVFSRHSNANPTLEDGRGAKEWPETNWLRLSGHLHARGFDIIAVGSENDPRLDGSHIRHLYGLPIKIVAALLEGAACVVTLENGIAHATAAFDVPVVQLYAPIVPLAWAFPAGAANWRTLYELPRKICCEQVIDAVEHAVDA